MGISNKSSYRIEAGIKYIIMEFAGNGHCYVPLEELNPMVQNYLSRRRPYRRRGKEPRYKGSLHLITDEEKS